MADEPEQGARRWRVVLGGAPDGEGTGHRLGGGDTAIGAALAALYDSDRAGSDGAGTGRGGGLNASAPRVARWLGDIRKYFPSTVVQVMQADAIERLNLSRMLLEPEMLDAVEPDIHLVGTLLSLTKVMPERSKRAVRLVVAKVGADLQHRLEQKTRAAVTGALNRAARLSRPRHGHIDWDRTIRANLPHYRPALVTVIPQRLIGYGRANRPVQ